MANHLTRGSSLCHSHHTPDEVKSRRRLRPSEHAIDTRHNPSLALSYWYGINVLE